jgi:aminopeptidase N
MAGQRWVERSLGSAGDVALTLYDLPGSGLAAALDAGRVRGMVSFMAERFGPFPYGTALRFVAAPTTWAGFEHPGNIALAETLARGNAEHTTFHEIAHQWAGDQTTIASVRDFVWKESMAEYLSFVYETTRLGEAQALAAARTWKDSARQLRFHPVPASDAAINDFYGSAYGPGPMVLFRQLEVRYSREAVMGALQDVLGRPRALSLDDLRRALEARTGASLEAYVRGWLVGDGPPTWPTVRVDRNTTPEGAVTVTVNPHGSGRGTMFVVRVEGAGGERQDVAVDLGIDASRPLTVTARPGFVVTRVTLDPDAQALVFEEPAAGSPLVVAPARPWLAP